MSLTDAMKEAWAANPSGEVMIETLEFNHLTAPAPVRVVTGVDEDISLPLVLSEAPVLFTAVGLRVTVPGMGEDGPTPMRVSVNNVGNTLLPFLRAALLAGSPITVIYRAYTTDDLTQPGDVIHDLEFRKVRLTPTWVEGTLGFREIDTQAFPGKTYDEEFYPALQNN